MLVGRDANYDFLERNDSKFPYRFVGVERPLNQQ